MIYFYFIVYFVFLQTIILALRYKNRFESLKNSIGTKEASKILGVNKHVIYKLIAKNNISPVINKNGKYLFFLEDVKELSKRRSWKI